MLKKIFVVACLLTAIIFGGNPEVSAQEVPIQSFSSRVQCYVLTETFVNKTQYRNNRTFSVDVKFVGATERICTYAFRENDCMVFYSVDGGEDELITEDEFAEAIWNYGLKHLGLDYEVRCDG